MTRYDYIGDNLKSLKQNIQDISYRFGRNPDSIKIVAVSKTFSVEEIEAARNFGQIDFGENRVQELINKQKEISDMDIKWHFVGHLQSNKVKYIVPFVHLIHSVDSLKLASEIHKEASKTNRIINCLLQVNTSNEFQKSGCEIRETLILARQISFYENIRLNGLMTIAKILPDRPEKSDLDEVRMNFKVLKNLYDDLQAMNLDNTDIKYLSMGMSMDFEIALEEGSNMIRVGTLIFGKRN